jgi:hypothetical protein
MDGRIFLSANPSLPGAVFYSSKDQSGNTQPTYFGINGYFLDGLGTDPVTDLLSVNGELEVFKARDDGEGTIFCHKAEKNESGGTSYPVSYVHGNAPVFGGAICFSGEAVFLTERGVCALDKAGSGNFREVECRSKNVTPLLSREDMKQAETTEWLGYLVVAVKERFYLADPRDAYSEDGVLQYEWYRLTNIGTYKNDRLLYRYSTMPLEGYTLSDKPDEAVEGIVYSEAAEGETVYFVYEGERKIRVYPTEERVGGVFDPCRSVRSDGALLFFGTEGGDVCVFNNDKRGVPPSELSEEADFDAEEYEKAMGRSIHPSYYSFARHRAKYGVVTPFDDCDIPYLTKNTVRDSLVISFKTFSDCAVPVRAETDSTVREKIRLPLSRLAFDRMDFSTFTPSVSGSVAVTLPEAERGWLKKRYSIYSDGFCSPFGVYSISYRYKIKGKIKE